MVVHKSTLSIVFRGCREDLQIKPIIKVFFCLNNWKCLYHDSSQDIQWNIASALKISLRIRLCLGTSMTVNPPSCCNTDTVQYSEGHQSGVMFISAVHCCVVWNGQAAWHPKFSRFGKGVCERPCIVSRVSSLARAACYCGGTYDTVGHKVGHSWTGALWNCGTLELWHSETVTLWNCDTLELWHSGTVALWNCGTLAQWHSRTVALWNCGTLELWHSGTGIPKNVGYYYVMKYMDKTISNPFILS